MIPHICCSFENIHPSAKNKDIKDVWQGKCIGDLLGLLYSSYRLLVPLFLMRENKITRVCKSYTVYNW